MGGTFEAWPKGKSLIRPGRVAVSLGAAMAPPARADNVRERFVSYSSFTDELETAVQRLAEEQP